MTDNYPPGAKYDINAPYNDDTIDCPECDDDLNRDGYVCYYCSGRGVVSKYNYNMIKRLERDESDL